MKNGHPSDWEIQEYARDKTVCSRSVVAHIEFCALCGLEVKNYQLLFSELGHQKQPVFDFDLSDAVLKKLPQSKSRPTADRFIAGFLVFFIGCFICVPLVLFNRYILNMFSGISPFFVYSIVISATVIALIKVVGLYRVFQKQMQLINFN